MIIDNPIVSGSLNVQNAVTASNISIASTASAAYFTGSFVGDGTQLSGVTSYTDADTLDYINSLGVLSGSAQIATDISGAFASTSQSLAERIASQESFSQSLDATFATDQELSNVSGALALSISNISTDFADITNKPTLISSSAQFTDLTAPFTGSFTGSFIGDGSQLSGVTSYTDADTLAYINSRAVLSGSIAELTSVTASFTNTGSVTIPHSFNSKNVSISVYDSNDILIIPQEVALISNSAVKLTFGGSTSGFAVVSKGGHIVSGSVPVPQVSHVSDTFSSATSHTVTHNFNTKDVIVSVYENDEVIIPDTVTTDDLNNVTVTFPEAISGRVVVVKAGHIISGSLPFDNITASPFEQSTSAVTASKHIVPSQDQTYDLGSPSLRFRDIYLSSASIYLGNKTISEDNVVTTASLQSVLPSGVISSSNQLAGETIDGDLTITGTVTAQEFHTEYVSASIIYQSGSTQFGDTSDDVHEFTGSLIVSGGIVGDVFSSNNFTALSQGINIEPGDTAQSTFRFDSNKLRFFNGNVGELFSVTETGEATLQIPVGSGDPTLNVIATSATSGTGNPSVVLKRSNEETLKLEGVANVEGRISAVAAGVGNLTFYTGTGFSGIIDLNGRLGIGTNDPNARTHIYNVDNTLNQIAFKVDQRDGAAAIAGFYQAGTETHSFTTTGTNSGILKLKSGGTNIVQLHTAGDSYFNGGNVGINETNPTAKLHVTSTAADWSAKIKNYTANAYGLSIDLSSASGDNYALATYTPTGTGFFVKAGGNVGIGIASPSAPLHVDKGTSGTIAQFEGTGSIHLAIEESGSNMYLDANNGNAVLGFKTNDVERMRIDSAGSVIHRGPTGAGTNMQESWYYGTDSNYRLNLNQIVSSGLVKHSFDTVNAGTTYSNNLVLDRGNVGIGTASPEDGLHIYSPGNGKGLTVEATDGEYESAVIKLYPKSPSANERNWALSAYEIGSEDFTISSSTTKGGDPYGGNVRLLIDGLTGDIGIGNTSPQNYSGYRSVHIGNGSTGGTGLLKFGTGTTANGPEIYAATVGGVERLLLNTNGSTNAMVLNGSSVGIGTDGPSEKFHVKNGTGDEITDFTVGTGGAVTISRNHALAPSIATNFGSGRANINLTTSSVLTTKISTGDSYFNGGNVGINDTSPTVAKLSVVSSDSSVPTLRISNEIGGGNNFVFQRWAYIRTTDAYKLDLTQEVSSGLVQYRFDVTNNSSTYNANLVLDRGNVGIGATSPPERLYVNGRIRTPEGQISPTFYIARNYANAWGSASGYDDIQVGDIINLKDHTSSTLQSFMHGQMSPIVNGGESMSWNSFRILFRWTRSTNSYTSSTVGFKVAGYFYSIGWYDASSEFSVNGGTDSDRGPRWGASPWVDYSAFSNTTDVPGIGLKLHSSSESGITLRVHAAYIQYKY